MGIINSSALAREIKAQIQKTLYKTVEIGALAMAIKRLETKLRKEKVKLEPLLKIFGDITVRLNLSEFTFINTPSLAGKQKELLQELGNEKNIFLTATQSLVQTTLIINSQFKNKLEKIYQGEKIISNIDNLSAITLTLSEETIKTPGVYYAILKTLAWYGINIIEVVSSFNELTIILESSSVDQAFSVLKNS